MKSPLRFFPLLALVILALPVRADGIDPATKDKVPPIAFVQARIYQQLKLADFTLNGSVHSDKSKTQYPIQLLTKGHVIVYKYLTQPLQIRVKLDPGAFSVEKRTSDSGAWAAIPTEQMTQPILNTDVTYGDLGLDFINWDDVEPVGLDSIKTLPAYVFDAIPGPQDHSPFAKVRFWVSSQYWAFLRIDGINLKGQTVKRVEVQDVMTIDNYTVFKEMKVATMDPERNDIAQSTTFIDIADGKQGSGLPDEK